MSEENSEIGDAVSIAAADATEEERTEPEIKAPSTIEPNTYNIKPVLEDRFKASAVQDVIHEVLTQELTGKVYSATATKEWTENIANIINKKVRAMNWKRYKHIVHVVIGEQRGAGVKSGVKCIWDSETDNYASDTFISESLFCVAAVFAIYFY